MKPHVQVVRKLSPEPPKSAPQVVDVEGARHLGPQPDPPAATKGSLEKQFVKELLKDKLLNIRLSTGDTVRGRIIYWDKYTFGVAPVDGMPMMVHKDKLVTIQPVDG